MIPVIHNKCGKVAFYFKKRLYPNDIIYSNNVVLLNGEPATPGTEMVCGSCHEKIIPNNFSLTQKLPHWKDWFIPKEEIWKQNK